MNTLEATIRSTNTKGEINSLIKYFKIAADYLHEISSDFEIVMVDYPRSNTQEDRDFRKKLVETKPSQVKLIQPIKRSEIARYYTYADAVIANLFIGTFEMVGLESVMCGTPVIQYTDRKKKIIVKEFMKHKWLGFPVIGHTLAHFIYIVHMAYLCKMLVGTLKDTTSSS